MMDFVQLGLWNSQLFLESHNPFHGSSHHQPVTNNSPLLASINHENNPQKTLLYNNPMFQTTNQIQGI